MKKVLLVVTLLHSLSSYAESLVCAYHWHEDVKTCYSSDDGKRGMETKSIDLNQSQLIEIGEYPCTGKLLVDSKNKTLTLRVSEDPPYDTFYDKLPLSDSISFNDSRPMTLGFVKDRDICGGHSVCSLTCILR